MGSYWDKINIELARALAQRAKIASSVKENFIEAAILQNALVESILRTAITEKVGSRSKRFKKYWDGDARFSQLIDYYELLGAKKSLVERLRKYNQSRNKIVHHLFEFKDIRSLILESKKNYGAGKILYMQIANDSGVLKKYKK